MDIEKLEKLHSLKEKGVITQKEFDAQKAKLMGDTNDIKTDRPSKTHISKKYEPQKAINGRVITSEEIEKTIGVNAWFVAVSSLLVIVLSLIIEQIFPNAHMLTFSVYMIPFGACYSDAYFLRKYAGHKGNWVKYGWLWGSFLAGIWLIIRAKHLKEDNKFVWIWVACATISILIYIIPLLF